MGAAGAGGVGDAELIRVEKQGVGVVDFKDLLFTIESVLLLGECVDETVAEGGGQGSVLAFGGLDFVIVDILVLANLAFILILYIISYAVDKLREGRAAHLGSRQLEVTDLDQILNLAHEGPELDASHVQQASRTLSMHRIARDLIVLLLQAGDHIKRIRSVGVEALDEGGVERDLLELVSVHPVLLVLELFVHCNKSVNELLALAVSLGLSGRGRRGSVVASSADGGRHCRFGSSHCGWLIFLWVNVVGKRSSSCGRVNRGIDQGLGRPLPSMVPIMTVRG